jgi:hypothetical protein
MDLSSGFMVQGLGLKLKAQSFGVTILRLGFKT